MHGQCSHHAPRDEPCGGPLGFQAPVPCSNNFAVNSETRRFLVGETIRLGGCAQSDTPSRPPHGDNRIESCGAPGWEQTGGDAKRDGDQQDQKRGQQAELKQIAPEFRLHTGFNIHL